MACIKVNRERVSGLHGAAWTKATKNLPVKVLSFSRVTGAWCIRVHHDLAK